MSIHLNLAPLKTCTMALYVTGICYKKNFIFSPSPYLVEGAAVRENVWNFQCNLVRQSDVYIKRITYIQTELHTVSHYII